jgi:proline dehydrogenase
VLQAYLHRTAEDVAEAVRRGDRVRLCKGAYKEPDTIAWTDMDDIRKSFKKSARLLLDRGNYPAIATHDEELVQDTLGYAREEKIAAARFEFQMLYGLRPRRWDELVAAGQNVRIYVPYGTHWMPYFYRRLRERKENVFFVLKGLFGG